MEKHAICIQCHNRPEQINRLISLFPKNQFDFYVHVDAKSNIFDQIERRPNVYFADRVDVRWGQFSQVEATLALFRCFRGADYRYVHLISGNDYPVMAPDKLYETLSQEDNEYIESNKLPVAPDTWSWGGRDRYEVYYPQWMIQRPQNHLLRYARVAYREFVMRTKIFRRKKLPVSTFYGGSSWFSITGKMVEWMKQYIVEHPDYRKFFMHGVCSDEVFFSTLARYSPFEAKIANQCRRYMLWEGSKTGGPWTLQAEQIDDMVKNGGDWFFARKIASNDTITEIEKLMNAGKL